MLEYTSEELLGTFLHVATHPDDLQANLELFQSLPPSDTGACVFQARYIRKDGSLVWGTATTCLVRDAIGNPQYNISVIENTTERRALEEQLRHQALHDALTSLPNRRLANDRLERAILRAKRSGSTEALLLIDLDRFKQVNDTMGHHAGDVLLQEVAARIKKAIRESDTVGRLGGDEFAVLLHSTDEATASRIACKIQEGLQLPLVLEGQRVDLTASIGIAVYPHHGHDAETITRCADMAMYAAKGSGSGHRVYLPAHNLTSVSRLALVADLRHAIEHEQLFLQFQPKVNMQSGTVVEMEALVRWHHPEHCTISAG